MIALEMFSWSYRLNRGWLVGTVVICTIASNLTAGERNRNSLYWSLEQDIVDTFRFGAIIPEGDVFIASVDSSELKLMGYHVTNAEVDDLYFGALCLSQGTHVLIVYSLKPGKTRQITAERDGGYKRSPLEPNDRLPVKSNERNIVTEGASGSKMIRIELDVVAGCEYSIKAGKTPDEWKVVDTKSRKVVTARIAPLFEN